ncbi:MAG: zf-HC2 domain-containing protein [bacterium]|uniref:Zf-HC2 domain-containing protein n=1 Tax=Candidatus Methylomirabilis tolerans TaxID=3123416 RepID=A0AAJ1AJW7_9BACT|nr:zf-HC2 domain-containing protein [Candidatus Methylomirabilis sp.]
MECQEIRVYVSAYIDDALTADERETVARHLSSCECCSTFLVLELKTKRLLAERLPQPQLPSDLRERIVQGLAEAEPRTLEERWGFPLWFRRPAPIVAMAFAFVLLLALGIFYATPRLTQASPFVRDSVEGHVKCLLGEQTMEVKFATPEELARWFQERLNVSVRLPRFTRQEQRELWEGRLSLMGGERAGQLFYRWKGRTLSLFVLPGEKLAIMSGEKQIRSGRTFYVNHHKGYTSLMWKVGDLTYCLVSDLSLEEVMTFASEEQA